MLFLKRTTEAASGDAGFLKIVNIVQFLKQVFFVCLVMVMEFFYSNLNCFVLRETSHETVTSKKSFDCFGLCMYASMAVFFIVSLAVMLPCRNNCPTIS